MESRTGEGISKAPIVAIPVEFRYHPSMNLSSPPSDSHAEEQERIVVDPEICNGRPVVRGTRISVQTVVEFLAAGDSVDDVLEGYQSLTREDVMACLAWAARLMGNHFRVTALS